MAHRRSRSRSLSGSPAHHSTEAVLASEMATEAYRKAKTLAARGECGAAFANIHRGGFDQGTMAAHQMEDGAHVPLGIRKAVVKHYEEADAAFRKACMMGPASKLSGMRSRRRRSRK